MKRIFLPALAFLTLNGCAIRPKPTVSIAELNYPVELQVVTRQQWGWIPMTAAAQEHTITKITIHHEGVDFPPDKDPVESIRTLQKWSRAEKNWPDIPYHFMIDLNGKIYETRPINYAGDTNTTYDPTGHALICLMGNYENIEPTENQLNSLVALTAFLAKTYDVPVSEIKGHKDYAETLCPGENLYKFLQDGTIQKRVAIFYGVH